MRCSGQLHKQSQQTRMLLDQELTKVGDLTDAPQKAHHRRTSGALEYPLASATAEHRRIVGLLHRTKHTLTRTSAKRCRQVLHRREVRSLLRHTTCRTGEKRALQRGSARLGEDPPVQPTKASIACVPTGTPAI